MTNHPLKDDALDQLLRQARTHNVRLRQRQGGRGVLPGAGRRGAVNPGGRAGDPHQVQLPLQPRLRRPRRPPPPPPAPRVRGGVPAPVSEVMKTNRLSIARLIFSLLTLGSAALAAPACLAQQPGGRPLTQADVAEYTQVLNPGKADDWPLQARDGETVIAGVRSNAFDPVVALVDANGAVVAENDDVRPGVKDALLLRRVAAGGAYRVRVRASEAQGAGTYRLTVRRF